MSAFHFLKACVLYCSWVQVCGKFSIIDLHFYREYEARNEPAQKIKEEVEYHLAEQKILEQTIPSNIGIGPYHILTEQVRQGLSKKRKALANSMLELLARRLRKQAEDACEEFKCK